MAVPEPTCPLCERALDQLAEWDTAPENALARHLIAAHEGWEDRLGLLAAVLVELDGLSSAGPARPAARRGAPARPGTTPSDPAARD